MPITQIITFVKGKTCVKHNMMGGKKQLIWKLCVCVCVCKITNTNNNTYTFRLTFALVVHIHPNLYGLYWCDNDIH